MTHRPVLILLFVLLASGIASAQHRESASQVVTFGVKFTLGSQRSMQGGVAEQRLTDSDLHRGTAVEPAIRKITREEVVPEMRVQGNTVPRRQSSSLQSLPAVRVITITD
jgi:hypothetical protein